MIIKDGILKKVEQKDIVNGCLVIPDSVVEIASQAAEFNDYIISVVIPGSVKKIGSYAFYNCSNIVDVTFNEGLEVIGDNAFQYCTKINELKLPSTLKVIENGAFYFLYNLEEIVLPKNLEKLGDEVFKKCRGIKRVKINANLESIGIETFCECNMLSEINIPAGVKRIGKEAFKKCGSLENIVLPDGLDLIGASAFFGTKIKEIKIPDSVSVIRSNAFCECSCLEEAILPKKLECIEPKTFCGCTKLKHINLEDTITKIETEAFYACKNLVNLKLPKNLALMGSGAFNGCQSIDSVDIPATLKVIPEKAFAYCYCLSNIKFHEGLEEIGELAFGDSRYLTEINFPNGLIKIGKWAFYEAYFNELKLPKSLVSVGARAIAARELTVYNTTHIDNKNNLTDTILRVINNNTGEVVEERLYGNNNVVGDLKEEIAISDGHTRKFFDYDNKWVTIEYKKFHKYKGNYKTTSDFKKLCEWIKHKKFIPHSCVVINTKLEDIDNFYINGNAKRWKEIQNVAKIQSGDEREGLFKISYALGLFSKSGKESEKAFKFIKKYVLKYIKKGQLHVRYGALNTFEMGYNKEFAELVFKYLPIEKRKFLKHKNSYGEFIDYFAPVYNNFDYIKQAYPNKVVKTNTKNDMLTPELCVKLTMIQTYTNIKKGNEEFAKNISIYGYKQAEFEYAQELFEKGKSIPDSEITLHIKEDKETRFVSYELLKKDDPLGVVLGNLTNCCQTLTGLGKSCVEYGLSQRNSKFMVFRKGNMIIGQSWVWYDEKSKRICLDNIELPRSVSNRVVKSFILKKELISCLKRATKSFLEEMNDRGLEVNSITVGAGYNEVSGWLGLNFKEISKQPKLFGYNGYTDASSQYVLYSK